MVNLTYFDDFVAACVQDAYGKLGRPARVVVHPPLSASDLPNWLTKKAAVVDELPADLYRLRDRVRERSDFWRVGRSTLEGLCLEEGRPLDAFAFLVDRLTFYFYFDGPESINRRSRRWRFTHLLTTLDRRSPVTRCLRDRAGQIKASLWAIQHDGFFTAEHADYDFTADRFYVRTAWCARVLTDRLAVPPARLRVMDVPPACPFAIADRGDDVWAVPYRAADNWAMRRLTAVLRDCKHSRPLWIICRDAPAKRDWRWMGLPRDRSVRVIGPTRRVKLTPHTRLITLGLDDWAMHGVRQGLVTICYDPVGHLQSRRCVPPGLPVKIVRDDASLLAAIRSRR